MKKTILFIALIFTLSATNAVAQKIGYLDSQALLLQLPEIEAANSELETYQKQLLSKGEGMVKTFEANYQKYVADVNAGTLSKVQMQTREAELGKEQQAIQAYELDVQQKLGVKREALYSPILDRVKEIVDQVGKDNGFYMILDSSTGVLLHANESEDVMGLVKAKLGI